MGLSVFVVDAHDIFRRGLASCLAGQGPIATVTEAASVQEAWTEGDIATADLVVIDLGLVGSLDLIRQLREVTAARVLVCASACAEDDLVAAVAAGAIGVLERDTLTAEGLCTAVRAVAAGSGVVDPQLLGSLLGSISRASREVLEPRGLSFGRLSEREVQVLRLVADGHPTREVARRLRYSERTIKSVIHDVVTKLNVRTRSQAVALAVREGLI